MLSGSRSSAAKRSYGEVECRPPLGAGFLDFRFGGGEGVVGGGHGRSLACHFDVWGGEGKGVGEF
jgi:hypothetical protein